MNKFRYLAWPALFWFLLFVMGPLLVVFAVSFMQKGTYGGVVFSFTLDNYIRVFSWSYLLILFESIKLATLTTLGCLILGLLCAWSMATAKPQHRPIYVAAIALPFLTNLIIRIYAIRVFIGFDGPIQTLLNWLHIDFDPFALTQNQYLVFYGMLTTYLPFMVLPLYAAFEKFDFSLVEAAQDLGASHFQILRQVIMPNLKRALFSGSLLVFIPCLGEYVIPDLLGGAKNMLYGNLITEQFLKSRHWPFGAALSVTLILILLLVWGLFKLRGSSHE